MARSPFRYPRFVTGFFQALGLWFLAQGLVLVTGGSAWKTALLQATISSLILALSAWILSLFFGIFLPDRRRVYFVFGASAILSWILTGLARFSLQSGNIFSGAVSLWPGLPYPWVLLVHFGMTALVAVVLLWWYSSQEELQLQARRKDTEALAREAELHKLRQQFQPHFLFNSLNSISALASLDPALSRKMIHQLADFLRGSIKREDLDRVSLKEELEYIQLYLEIEKVRFGNRLSTEFSDASSWLDWKVPPMLLQPMVENAIKFGLYQTTGPVTIRIDIGGAANELIVEISNPFDPDGAQAAGGTGFGLTSMRRRLFLLFGRHDLLDIRQTGQLFIAKLRVPQ